jgi:hypothetical protein
MLVVAALNSLINIRDDINVGLYAKWSEDEGIGRNGS